MSSLDDIAPSAPPAPSRRRRRTAVVAAGAVGVVAVAGAGVWAWQGWFAQGPQAAEALPADTLAYVGVDLDPPGGQKLAAYDTLRRFPSLKKHLGLSSQDDLRRSLVEGVTSDSGCDLSYDDLDDWAGDRAALAVVPQEQPEPVLVVQAGDAAAARAGLEKAIAGCGDDAGFATGDGWAVVARNEAVARQVLADSRKGRLADDRSYRELTGAAGDPGVVTIYASPEAGQVLLDTIEENPFFALFAFGTLTEIDPVGPLLSAVAATELDAWVASLEASGDDPVGEMPIPPGDVSFDDEGDDEGDDLPDDESFDETFDETFADLIPPELRKELANFGGLGGVARFEDGALEVELVAEPALPGATHRYDGTDALAAVTELPADVAIAFGGGFADGWAEDTVADYSPLGLWFGDGEKDPAAAFEKATGLSAADLAALGGERLAFAARADFTARAESGKPGDVPVAARVTGDAEAIEQALTTLRKTLGSEVASYLSSQRVDGGVLIGPSTAFLDELAKPGATLADDETFARVVRDAEDAVTIAYADFDAGDWLADSTLTDLSEADVAPLDAAGLVVTDDGDRQRMVLRVSFDE